MAELPMLPPVATILALLRGGVPSQNGVAEDFSSTHAAALQLLAEADRKAVYVSASLRTGALRYHYKAYRALSSPLWRLPRELLVEILRLCLRFPAGGWSRRYLLRDLRRSEQLFEDYLKLARVCTYWRSVLRNSPQIWSCVPLDGSEYPDYYDAYDRVRKLSWIFLNFAGQAPLEVYFTSVTTGALEAVASTMPRWRSASMGALDYVKLTKFALLARGQLTSLERLRLPSQSWSHSTPLPPTALEFLVSATSLRFLSVSGHMLPLIPAVVLNSLEVLVCTANLTTVLNALKSMPIIPQSVRFRLEYYCTLEDTDVATRLDRLSKSTIESGIQSLTFGVGNFLASQAMDIFQRIFHVLRLPNLADLTLISTTSQSRIERAGKMWTADHHPLAFPCSWPQQELSGISLRSHWHRSLRVLDIRDTHIALEELLKFISDLDMLERLFISDHPVLPYPVHVVATPLFAALTAAPMRLPHLTHILLHSMLRFSDTAFLAFLAARNPQADSGATFECHVRALPGCWREFGFRSHADVALQPQLAALRKNGRLRLSWSCEQPRPRIGDIVDSEGVPSALSCDGIGPYHPVSWIPEREPSKALSMEERRLLGIW